MLLLEVVLGELHATTFHLAPSPIYPAGENQCGITEFSDTSALGSAQATHWLPCGVLGAGFNTELPKWPETFLLEIPLTSHATIWLCQWWAETPDLGMKEGLLAGCSLDWHCLNFLTLWAHCKAHPFEQAPPDSWGSWGRFCEEMQRMEKFLFLICVGRGKIYCCVVLWWFLYCIL